MNICLTPVFSNACNMLHRLLYVIKDNTLWILSEKVIACEYELSASSQQWSAFLSPQL